MSWRATKRVDVDNISLTLDTCPRYQDFGTRPRSPGGKTTMRKDTNMIVPRPGGMNRGVAISLWLPIYTDAHEQVYPCRTYSRQKQGNRQQRPSNRSRGMGIGSVSLPRCCIALSRPWSRGYSKGLRLRHIRGPPRKCPPGRSLHGES